MSRRSLISGTHIAEMYHYKGDLAALPAPSTKLEGGARAGKPAINRPPPKDVRFTRCRPCRRGERKWLGEKARIRDWRHAKRKAPSRRKALLHIVPRSRTLIRKRTGDKYGIVVVGVIIDWALGPGGQLTIQGHHRHQNRCQSSAAAAAIVIIARASRHVALAVFADACACASGCACK